MNAHGQKPATKFITPALFGRGTVYLAVQGGSFPLAKGGVEAPPAERRWRAAPKAVTQRGFTYAYR